MPPLFFFMLRCCVKCLLCLFLLFETEESNDDVRVVLINFLMGKKILIMLVSVFCAFSFFSKLKKRMMMYVLKKQPLGFLRILIEVQRNLREGNDCNTSATSTNTIILDPKTKTATTTVPQLCRNAIYYTTSCIFFFLFQKPLGKMLGLLLCDVILLCRKL